MTLFDNRSKPSDALIFHGQKRKNHHPKTIIKSGRMVTFSSGRVAIFKNK